eukprot:8910912-Pyramimonas_sp.AAC.3
MHVLPVLVITCWHCSCARRGRRASTRCRSARARTWCPRCPPAGAPCRIARTSSAPRKPPDPRLRKWMPYLQLHTWGAARQHTPEESKNDSM